MVQSIARVIGCSGPAAFAAHDSRTFFPADNGVVVVENGGEHLWLPFPSGKYPIDKVAISSAGVLCVTEKRLRVTLHFFDVTSLHSLGCTETEISVSVADIVFSADGTELFVLATVPDTAVSVFCRSTRDGAYSFADCVPLQHSGEPKSLLAGSAEEAVVRFAICRSDGIVGYSHGDDGKRFQKCLFVEACVESACFSGPNMVCYATKEGSVHVYSHDSQTSREVCKAPAAGGAAAMLALEDTAFIFTRSGALLSVDLADGTCCSLSLGCLPSCPGRIAATSGGELLLSTQTGLLAVAVPTATSRGGAAPRLVKGWMEASTLKCLSVNGGALVAWVLRDGSVALYERNAVRVFASGEARGPAVHACVLSASQIAILFEDATVVCFDCMGGKDVWAHKCLECTPIFVEADGCGALACCGRDAVRFLSCLGDSVEDRGIVRATLLASICLARWVPLETSLLVVCENGDAFLMEAPADGDAMTTHPAETLVRKSWRLDFPITDALVCYATPDVLNLLVHSADHDSKVYTLDRQREGDVKVSRPLFLIHDHSSGGSCLLRLSDATVISCGRDGSIAARDLTPYQVQMTPIPPSREKRKPLWIHAARSSFCGGITTAAIADAGAEVVCGGDDGVMQCVALKAQGAQATWQEPEWTHAVRARLGTVEDEATAVQASDATPEREALLCELSRVRELWAKAMSEKDADVPLEAFLTPEQREQFAAECESAVLEMREGHYYHAILNEYLQDTIKRRCFEAMEVTRMKVVSMNTPGLEVHNFHIHRRTRAEASLSRKALFLRQLQEKISAGRRTPPGMQIVSKTATHVAVSPSGAEDFDTAMLNDADVYTQCRMVLQSLLVKGRSLVLKDAFNACFTHLQDLKRQSVMQMEERTQRCITIGKQLGSLPAQLFSAVVDSEESPNSLFVVEDKELGAEAQALIPPSKGTVVVSPVDEAALHLWMDGLEKEVERLEVHVPLPDFADDTRDTFVPPEERTEEQTRIVEAYAKRLKEENECVEAKREALRGEFKALQEKNQEAAETLEEQLRQIRQLRLSTAEEVDEAELQLALLFQHRLCVSAAYRQHRSLARKREALRDGLTVAESIAAQQKRTLTAAQARLTAAESKTDSYAASARVLSPFDDAATGEKLHRRFVRWQRRFEDGKAPLPDADTPAPDCTAEQWAAFCDHCQTVAKLQQLVDGAEGEVQRAAEDFREAQQRCKLIAHQIDVAGEEMDAVRESSVTRLLDVHALCRLHQGQIQDESATTATAFSSFNLRWHDDVAQYNDLILQSDAESRALLNKVFARRKLMKLLEWEGERLRHCAGTLQLELRQLHTLRVTRQMQEWLNGEVDLSEEKTLAHIQRHMDLVETNMSRKVEELRSVVRQLKNQIAERVTENTIIGEQCGDLDDTVRASGAVYRLVETRADGSHARAARATEIFVTSELEELARSQQEELVRLKHDVDRLRERTFPSFAVVSKQTR
ncbi:conserved hypothetical protein [Leishmania major strain Friedlin]|uniref:Cilia- and flagella-associated protein 43 n=1 Tax=Leishmania major TaxID=5664 RepID=Q4Q5U0_LEIMA|nr:conserved hypothetical protein [Leishmania major strain Friedlin]CAG9579503.1 cilia_and_flagella_associated_protein_43/CFAP43 [Leishmania major strain Friedlin]CAJ08604.1 conserved hypothetical protein [Leishmania major strain Friedlin]|eukprot:XP_001685308.1 conserved hypothetical protein [Leishmania major strain Friedlin]